jgi:hypothetical protein
MRSSWFVIAALLLCGCVRLGFDEERPVGTDHGATPDAALDAPAVDAPLSDAPVDPDGAVVDAPLLVDVVIKPDKAPADKTVALPDGLAATACASGKPPTFVYAPNMVICSLTSSGFSQCGVPLFCNVAGGWSSCTASQFRARGGKTKGTPIKAWLRSCVRDGANATTPTDSNCTCGKIIVGPAIPLAWICSGASSISSIQQYMGVATYVSCQRVGVNQSSTEAFWRPTAATTALSAMVCCR